MHFHTSLLKHLAAGLVCLASAACSQATATASAPASASAPGSSADPAASVIGSWSRVGDSCQRPEFVLRPQEVILQIDADGTPQTFTFRHVRYAADAPGRITADLGEAHPYGKAPSKTALSFTSSGPDTIALVQRTKPVPLQRCPQH